MTELPLTPEDRERVSAAVTAAEGATAGEIVTILTDRSDGYSDVALAWAALVAATALLVLSLLPDFYLGMIDRVTGAWASEWTAGEVFMVALGVATLKFLGMLLIQLWQPLKFWLVPAPVKHARVRNRAVTCLPRRRGCPRGPDAACAPQLSGSGRRNLGPRCRPRQRRA